MTGKTRRTFSFYMQTYLNQGGQPQDTLSRTRLSAMNQYIIFYKDNRTPYFATLVL